MPKLTPAGLVTKSAIYTYLAPRLAQDSRINYNSVVAGLTARNFRDAKPAIIRAITKATRGKLAQDADISDLAALLDALTPNVDVAGKDLTDPNAADPAAVDPAAPDANGAVPVKAVDDEPTDIVAKIKAYLAEEGVPPEILANLDAFLANEDKPDPDVGETAPEQMSGDNVPDMGGGLEGIDSELEDKIPDIDPVNKGSVISSEGYNAEPGTAEDDDDEDEDWLKQAKDGITPKQQEGQVITKAAMDAAIKQAQQAERNNQRNIRKAEHHVRPWVGDMAMDAARPADIYRATLKALGMDAAKVDKLHPHALIPILEAQPKAQARRSAGQAQGRPTATMAADAGVAGSFAERFPMAGKVTVQ